MRGQDLEPSRGPWACDVARPPWKTLTVSCKVKCTFAAKPSNSTFVLSQRNGHSCPHTGLRANVISGLIHDKSNLETGPGPINRDGDTWCLLTHDGIGRKENCTENPGLSGLYPAHNAAAGSCYIGCCYKHLWHDAELLITLAVPGNAWVAADGSQAVS